MFEQHLGGKYFYFVTTFFEYKFYSLFNNHVTCLNGLYSHKY